ncbi:hypothetical protein [Glycomyces sp. NRRL B-16210]|uniref:hypothetical protein n=1 Tax=Glycomyces sp. NRRL B-16210 TaxID=1463821 RepID=UPI0004C133B4|nr:hypothetical protein [Glycomyces sp. NRRL B-16210]
MKDPQYLAAVAAILTALIALFALGLSIIGVVQSKSASKDAQAAREKASDAQWKMTEHLETIAVSLRESSISGAAAGSLGGQLTARLVRRGRGESLVVANVGTQPVRVEDIAVIDQPNILIASQVEPLRGSELLPGEDHSVLAALSLGTRLPLKVALKWSDFDGQQHEREQLVNFSN